MAVMEFEAFVLVGGRSRRMGFDKSTLLIDDERLVDRACATLRQSGATNVSVLGRFEHHLPPGVWHCDDDVIGVGPIGGLITAFRVNRSPTFVLMAVDLVAAQPQDIKALIDARRPGRAAVASDGRQVQPLLSCWPATFGSAVESAVSAGEHSMMALLDVVEHDFVLIDSGHLVNVNTPEDLHQWLGDR